MMLIVQLVGVCLALLVAYAVVYVKKKMGSIKNDKGEGLGGVYPWQFYFDFLRGNTLDHAENLVKHTKKYGLMCHYWFGHLHGVLIADPAAVQEVLHSQHDPDFVRVQLPLDKFTEVTFGDSVVQLDGERWKHHRNILNPSFHHAQLKAITYVFEALAKKLINSWVLKAESENGRSATVDVLPGLSNLTLDVIGNAGFGYDFGALDNKINRYLDAYHSIFQYLLSPLRVIPGVEYLPLPQIRKVLSEAELLNNLMRSMVAERKSKPNPTPQNILDLIIESSLHSDKSGYTLNEKEVKDNLFLLFVAGHETSASSLCMTLYLLATHPEIQEKLQSEIDNAGDNPFTWENLNKLEYLNAVIRESLRIYPPGHFMLRKVGKDVTIQGYHVPKGDIIFISIYAVHHNPDIWPEPEKFKPERFLGNSAHHLYSWIPFSAGPRGCLGMKFATLEMKTVLTCIMKTFNVRLKEGYSLEIDKHITLRPKTLPLVLELRKK